VKFVEKEHLLADANGTDVVWQEKDGGKEHKWFPDFLSRTCKEKLW